jgi:hypothetical protein
VILNDTPTLFFDKAAAAPFQTEENKDLLEWTATTGASTYDIATKQSISTATAPANIWLTYFSSMTVGGCSQACNDGDGDGLCQFSISASGSPAAGTLDFWLVRKHGGSWEEPGSSALPGPATSRNAAITVCP